MRTLINSMEMGNSYNTVVLVTDMSEGVASNGKPFVTFTISDGVVSVDAKMFSATLDKNVMYNKKVCNVSILASLYNGGPSYRIDKIALAGDEYTIKDFIVKAPMDSEKMYNQIIEVLNGCESSIKNIAINLYEQNKEKILYWSAAKSCHHNFYGGFLYHTLRMLSHACQVCKTYSSLNRSLLITGTVLHDIGKLVELETDEFGNANYTVDGNLLGHLLIGVEMITAEVAKNPDAYNEEEVRLLKHMVASHHQAMENGAIRKPATMEALALCYIDDMDAKMQVCESTFADMVAGEVMSKEEFATKTRLYKPNL